MDASDFISAYKRLPTPQECIAQIKKLGEESDLAYQAYASESITAEIHRLQYVYFKAKTRAKNEGTRYSYICVAVEAEADDEMIHAALDGEPHDQDTIVAYYKPLVKQMIVWKAMKNLTLEVVPTYF